MYYFIVNEHGGSGKAVRRWDIVKEIIEKKQIPYKAYIPEYPGHATKIAEEISLMQDNDIRLVVVGGDGTINEVLNGIKDFDKIKFGLIPTGSGNDFSRGLNLPRHNPHKAIQIILDSKGTKKIDLGQVNIIDSDSEQKSQTRLFGISSGFGLDALVGTTINTAKIKIILNKLHMGKLSYAFLTVQTLFSMTTQNVSVSFDNQTPQFFKNLIFLAAMNFKAEGGGVPMAPKAKGDDGKLSICIAANVPKWLTFLMFPFLILGLHSKMKGFCVKDCRTMEIVSDKASILHTDGEFGGNVKHVKFSCLESKLTVLV